MSRKYEPIAAMLILSTSAVYAQETEHKTAASLEEIIVTATKREENLQDVPVAVTAISSADLIARGVFETSDLNSSMPNLQVSSPYGKQQPNFTLRGVGVGTEFNANAASPVGVYVDEVYQAFRTSHGQQLYDLNQIEVVRGPQGTLYGRNTTGGAVNFITHAPSLEGTEGYASVGYGNFNRVSAESAVETTLLQDTLGIRLAGTFAEADSYLDNVLPAGLNTSAAGGASGLNTVTGRDPGGWRSTAGRLTVRFKPTDTADFRLKLYAGKMKGTSEANIAFGQRQDSDEISYVNSNFLLAPLFQSLAPLGLLPESYSRSARGLGEREIEEDTLRDAYSKARGIVFNANIELADQLRLISISGYDEGQYVNQQGCDATPLRLCAISYDSKFRAFNQDIRLDGTFDRIKVIAGAYYGRDSLTANNEPDFFNFLRDINAAVGSPAGYFNPGGAFSGTALSASSLPTGVTAVQHYRQQRKSYALYSEGSYELTTAVKLTAGLRYTIDKLAYRDGMTNYYDDLGTARMITVSDFQQSGAFAPYFLQPVRNEAGAIVIPSSSSLGIPMPGGFENDGESKRFSGRVILDWKPNDTSLLYTSYSHGYRAGTFNGLAYGTANQVYFVPPETVDAYEVGLKTRWFDDRLQVNGALFYYDYQGQQGQIIDNTATGNLVSLDGTINGLELEVKFAATDRLTLSATLGVLDSEYEDGACPATAISGFPAQRGSCVVSSTGAVSVAGNPFPYAPESTIGLNADWEAFDIGDGKVLLHADTTYTGRFYYDAFKDYSREPLQNVSTGKFSAGGGKYWISNARLTYETQRYSIAGWVKNLTDKTYYPYAIALENLFGNGHLVRAEPRTYGAEVTVRF
jgi:iron complex outermembrane recepter protein